MINFRNQVPSVYPNTSRDFQYVSWLADIVLNYVKHDIDGMYNLPHVGYNPKLSELLALTLGFKLKRNYDQKQLAALVEILPSVLKCKGTIKALKMAAESLITASGAIGDASCEVTGTHIDITLPEDLSIDITLFIDLLDYILPAGMTCRVKRENRIERTLEQIKVGYSDTLHKALIDDLSWYTNNLSYGLSTLFDADADTKLPEFTTNLAVNGDDVTVNTGLLSNTVIPVLSSEEIISDSTVVLLSTEEDGTNIELHAKDAALAAKKSVQEY